MKTLIGLLLTLCISTLLADGWNCRNHDMEISCKKEKCEVSREFTPLDVYLENDGNISIGMYNGVWEGKVIYDDGYSIHIGKNLKFSTSD
jgi:hypothetical protein